MVILQVGKWYYPLISYWTINDEKSTMTYNDLMAFVGMDYAVAA